jgi:hypothetical protein
VNKYKWSKVTQIGFLKVNVYTTKSNVENKNKIEKDLSG